MVALKTGIFQPVPRGRGTHIVCAVAVGATQTGLAMHATRIGIEDGVVALAARGTSRSVIGAFGHHRMRIVAVGADRRVRVTLSDEGGVNASLVQLEYGGVTGFANFRLSERILTDAVDPCLDRGMVLERSVGMADGAPDLAMNRFRKRRAIHVHGKCFSVGQFFLEPPGRMAAETLLVQLGKSAAGSACGKARSGEH